MFPACPKPPTAAPTPQPPTPWALSAESQHYLASMYRGPLSAKHPYLPPQTKLVIYGLTGKVSSAWRAVTVLGLATVRALATTAAFDLFSEKGLTTVVQAALKESAG